MVLAIVILLLLICSALVGSLYSSFNAFFVNFSDSLNYTKAYYAAISWLERAELVLRYRQPGFQWTGGRVNEISYPSTPYTGDNKPNSDFSYFSQNNNTNGILRNIQSRTSQIPRAGEWNTDWMLITGDSQNYNKLDYLQAVNVLFMMDDSVNNPYQTWTLTKSTSNTFTGNIRLPQILEEDYHFWPLDDTDSKSQIWAPESPTDDPIVDWSFRRNNAWNPDDTGSIQLLSIASEAWGTINYNKDSRILESRINANQIMKFQNNSPFEDTIWSSLKTTSPHLFSVIWEKSNVVSAISNNNLSYLLQNYDWIIFRLSLLNLLYSTTWQLYPYLEYQLTFPAEVSDIFYNITTKWKYGNYEVQLFTKKPTLSESILRSFTVIF